MQDLDRAPIKPYRPCTRNTSLSSLYGLKS